MSRVHLRHELTSVRINVLDERAVLPKYGTRLSAGFDLAPVEAVGLKSGESKVYGTGLVVQAPNDHMLLVTPRSSTWRKWGLSLGNTVGIVDEDFCGPEDELCLYLHNPNSYDVIVPAGTRLAQGIFVPVTRASFVVMDDAIADTRGGWGSTGD